MTLSADINTPFMIIIMTGFVPEINKLAVFHITHIVCINKYDTYHMHMHLHYYSINIYTYEHILKPLFKRASFLSRIYLQQFVFYH